MNRTSSLSNIALPGEKKISGWIICKLKEEYDLEDATNREKFNEGSILNKICDLTYGVITDSFFPPNKNWVFLASGMISLISESFFLTKLLFSVFSSFLGFIENVQILAFIVLLN
jgi:hypothetical protein